MADDPTKPLRVAIAGGGLGGLACAKSLVDAGVQVVVLESLPYLGGRASTFRDADGDWVEQGLHVFFGTYSEFRQLLQEIGQPADSVLFWHDELHFEAPDGPKAVFGINPLHAPLRTAAGMLRNNEYLDMRDKLSLLPLVAPAALGMNHLRKFDDRTVEQWWARTSNRPRVLERFLQPFCRAIQFTDATEFSAYDFLGWIHHTIYGLPHARLGGYYGARDETIFRPLARYLEAHGATIRTNAKIVEILHAPEAASPHGRITGFALEDGTRIDADIFVCAMPAWTLAPLIPVALRSEPFFVNIGALPVASAIAVQLWFDRQIFDSDVYRMIPHSEVVVYQEQSLRTYPHHGSRLSIDVAPAEKWLGLDSDTIVHHVLDTLIAANPAIADAKLEKSVVLKHPQHLLRPLPGAMTMRPTQVTPVANFFLAGDWTQQDFFGSQEGAVRGGRACARAILQR